MAKKSGTRPKSIGELLRTQRVEVLGVGLREIAKSLKVSPAYITDIEYGRRIPSQDLLPLMAKAYSLPEAELRAGFNRPSEEVVELASANPTAAEKTPEFLRNAKNLSPAQWDSLIKQAKKLAGESGGGAA
ncbi:MAG: helix-turn-helix transcriptional regulator [Phycisphaerales bacterium]|nr:helix-turn-helix transcriptional regulator [Phycisphaerales bacterium]